MLCPAHKTHPSDIAEKPRSPKPQTIKKRPTWEPTCHAQEAGPKCGLVGLQQELAPGVAVDVPLRRLAPSAGCV